MPVLKTEAIAEGVRTGIWKITETEQELYGRLSLSNREKQVYGQLKTDLRKRQWLAYRSLVCDMLGTERAPIHNNEAGKPGIEGLDVHLSVSHTDQFAAVIISAQHEVGIDIERVRDRVLRIRDKFLYDDELSMLDVNDVEKHTILWCAKEALYKVYGKKNLDFRKHIKLGNLNTTTENTLKGLIHTDGHLKHYQLKWRKVEGMVMAYVIDDQPCDNQ